MPKLPKNLIFDPEKVRRYDATIEVSPGVNADRTVVVSSDYDQLLSLYRDMKVALGMGPYELVNGMTI